MYEIGIDLGGTQMRVVLAREDGTIIRRLAKKTVQTSAEDLYEQMVESIVEISGGCENLHAIGIGTAGRVDVALGQMVYATGNLPGWTGFPLKSRLQHRFQLPVYVDNDVNVAALGEGWLGGARHKRSYLLVFVGTGVGGAYVEDGKLIRGKQGGALEIGHMIHRPGGYRCNCGQRGCWETYTSGSALAKKAQKIWGVGAKTELIFQDGQHLMARKVREQFARSMAEGLVSLQQLFDPEVILLGGGVTNSFSKWEPELWHWINKTTPHRVHVQLAQLGEDAGVIGAIRLASTAGGRS